MSGQYVTDSASRQATRKTDEPAHKTSRTALIEAYQRCGDMRQACAETNVKPYQGFIWLKKAKVLSINEKGRYGTSGQRSGGDAEAEFQRLVPDAMPANKVLRLNNPVFDFDFKGQTIDVKYCGVNKPQNKNYHPCWRWELAKHKTEKPDFYAAFLAMSESGLLADGYQLLLVPHELFDGRARLSVRPDDPNNELWEFLVKPEELNAVLAGGGE